MSTQIYYLVFTILCIVSSAWSRVVTIDAHAEECFSDKVETAKEMALTYEVIEGGFLDIDVRIIGPDGKKIYEGERETSGNYTFSAHAPGVYTYCFSNKISTLTYKAVMFHMAISDAPKTGVKHGETSKQA